MPEAQTVIDTKNKPGTFGIQPKTNIKKETLMMDKTSVDFQGHIGETAGKIWNTLSSNGPQTLTQLKKVNGGADVVNFALGWLAREDKIEIAPDKKTYRIRLK